MIYESTWSIEQIGVTPAQVKGAVFLRVLSYDNGSDERSETYADHILFDPPLDTSGSGDPSGFAVHPAERPVPWFELNPQRQYIAKIDVSAYARGQWQGEYDHARCEAAVSFGLRWMIVAQRPG